MSGPFGVTLTVISAQKFSREIVVAASTFLSMGYLSIIPMGNDGAIRPEFLTALNIFPTARIFIISRSLNILPSA